MESVRRERDAAQDAWAAAVLQREQGLVDQLQQTQRAATEHVVQLEREWAAKLETAQQRTTEVGPNVFKPHVAVPWWINLPPAGCDRLDAFPCCPPCACCFAGEGRA